MLPRRTKNCLDVTLRSERKRYCENDGYLENGIEYRMRAHRKMRWAGEFCLQTQIENNF